MEKDWTKLYKDYKGLWVALKSDEETVITSGKTLSAVLDAAKQEDYDSPIVTKVPLNNIGYIGANS